MGGKRPSNILLTGRPGCGKTTLLVRLAERLAPRRLAGFYTQEIREGGRRTGFGVRTFRVDVEGFESVAVPELERPLEEVDLFLVDEIGKMECFSRRFVEAMRRLLDASIPVVAAVAMKGGGFIAEARARPDVALFEVTRENRDDLPRRICRMLDAGNRASLP